MRQAFHIFQKDARRLWPQIIAVALALAYFGLLEIKLSEIYGGNGFSFIPVLVGAAVWFLIVCAVHEDPLPGENQFWLTRPYDRVSLLTAKIMMAVFVVAMPLFVTDCLILALRSLPATSNLGGLLLRQLVTAVWLILPPFVIASVTRTLAQAVMAWLAGIAIAAFGYFPAPVSDLQAVGEKYPLIVAVGLMLIAIRWQYSRRSTNASRGLLAAAVLLPAIPFPQGALFALEQARVAQDPAAAAISVTARAETNTERWSVGYSSRNMRCAPIITAVSGLRPGWRIDILGENITFESGGAQWNSGWQDPWLRGANSVNACIDQSALTTLGTGPSGERKPVSVTISLAMAVLGEDRPENFAVRTKPFEVPGFGTCEFSALGPRQYYSLLCEAPVWFPSQGTVGLGKQVSRETISRFHYPWAPMNLLPGLSPVYKWIPLSMDGQIRDALEHGGQVEFRAERRIALLRRDVTVADVRFLPR